MSVVVIYLLKCDGCGKVPRPGAATPERAEAAAARGGWRKRRLHYCGIEGHLCPKCLANPPDWWPEEDAR